MTIGQSKSLIKFLDKDGAGEIDLGELDECMKQVSGNGYRHPHPPTHPHPLLN